MAPSILIPWISPIKGVVLNIDNVPKCSLQILGDFKADLSFNLIPVPISGPTVCA